MRPFETLQQLRFRVGLRAEPYYDSRKVDVQDSTLYDGIRNKLDSILAFVRASYTSSTKTFF